MRHAFSANPRFSFSDVRVSSEGSPFGELERFAEVHYWFWGRTALYQGLRATDPDDRTEVLVPDYHCATAIEPVIRAGCTPVYYRIRQDCSVDIEDLASKIHGGTRAILAVQFFGIPSDFSEIRVLCDTRDIYLIEDCAHCCFRRYETTPIGKTGDIAVYSPRKMFPVFDGGALVINRASLRNRVAPRSPGWGLELRAAKFVLDRRYSRRRASARTDAPDKVDADMVPRREASDASPALQRVTNFDLSFNPMTECLGITRVSRWFLEHLSADAVVTARQENCRFVSAALRKVPGVSCIDMTDDPDSAPWMLPVIVPGVFDPHRKLRAAGVPAAAWDGVIHHTLDIARHRDAEFLYHHLMFLPCHQTLTLDDLQHMVRQVEQLER